jgi:hypothetical protein
MFVTMRERRVPFVPDVSTAPISIVLTADFTKDKPLYVVVASSIGVVPESE